MESKTLIVFEKWRYMQMARGSFHFPKPEVAGSNPVGRIKNDDFGGTIKGPNCIEWYYIV